MARRVKIDHCITPERKFPDDVLYSALQLAKVGLWEWNMKTNDIQWSENVSSLFGLSKTAFEGTFSHYQRLIHPDDLALVLEAIQAAKATGKEYHVEHRIIFSDDTIRWLEGEGKVQLDEKGHVEKMTGMVRDITKRKTSEIQEAGREKLFAVLTEATRELLLNPNWKEATSNAIRELGQIIEVDRAYLFKMDGSSEAAFSRISQMIEWNSGNAKPQIGNPELQQMRLVDFELLFAPLLRGEPLNEIVNSISDHKCRIILQEQDIKSILIFPIEVRKSFWGLVGFDQCTYERKWTEIELSVLQSFSATLAGSIEKHEAESEKDEWKTKHELIVKASGQIIYDYEIATGNIQWSGSTYEELGYASDQMGDINAWVELIHPEDRADSFRKLAEAKRSMTSYDVYYRFRHKEGNYINVHDRGFFVSGPDGKAIRMLGMMMDVTESLARETEMRDIETAYKTLFNNTPDAIIIITTDTPSRVVSANIAAAKMHGYELEEFSKLLVKDIKSRAYAEQLHERLENLLRGERSSAESIHVRKDGSHFPVMIVSGIIEVQGQKYVMSIYRDISEAKITKDKLEESLSLLTATIESTADGILVVDSSGKVTVFNKKFTKLWKIPQELADAHDDDKLIGHVLEQLSNPEQFLEKVKYLYAHPSEKSEDLIHFKDGRVFHRYSKPQRIGDKVVGRVWSFRDYTSQVHYEKTLKESQTRFKRLQEASFGGIAIHDQSVIIDANQGLSNMTGYLPEELIGMDGVSNLIAPEYFDVVRKNILSNYDQPYDVEGIRKDGTRFFLEIHGKTIPYQGRTVRVTEFRDITSRKTAEQQILEEKTRLTSIAQNLTRKNDQLEEFTQIVSHNLRSPVGNISTLLNLHDQATDETEKIEILGLLRQTSASLLATMQELNEVLKIKQTENIERQELKFADVFEKVVNMFHAKIIQSDASITCDFAAAPTVNYAGIYLESIFLNLMSNALKYRDNNKSAVVHFKTGMQDGTVILKVSDNGLGINLAKYGHQVFKMKKTFHAHPDSRGIGLFMVKNQIESMGGEINIESKEGIGTTFTINFDKKS